MQTAEFFRRILPNAGVYVEAVFKPNNKAPQHKFFESVESLAASCVADSDRNWTVYHGIAAYKTKENRTQDNVAQLKAFPLDIDCGENKPYASQSEAVDAMKRFLASTGLPPPMVVSSGNGLHLYWTLTVALPKDVWVSVAGMLRNAALQTGFHIDTSKTTDPAAILRPVGTNNYKNGSPKSVACLLAAQDYSPQIILAALKPFAVPVTQHRDSGLSKALAVERDFAPANSRAIEDNCPQLQAISTSGGDVDEPLWYAALGVAAFCEEPETTAIRWSNGHPEFSEEKTIAKMNQWRARAEGPATCDKFTNVNSALCKTCKFKGKISTPAQLGVKLQKADAESLIDVTFKPPGQYKYFKNGTGFTLDGVDILVTPFHIYPKGIEWDQQSKKTFAVFEHTKSGTPKQLKVPMPYLYSTRNKEFNDVLGNGNILLRSASQATNTQTMLNAFINELKSQPKANALSMGWSGDNTFVLGDKMYYVKDNDVAVEDVGLSNRIPEDVVVALTPKGSLQDWVDLTSILNDDQFAPVAYTLALGFASPLFKFTGLASALISLVGPTGCGKTTSQRWSLSIYGDPNMLMISAHSTRNALENRLEMYGSLPLAIDEVSVMKGDDMGEFIYSITAGRDKRRLTQTAEEKASKRFHTIVVTSSNSSIVDKISTGNSNLEAQLARMVEHDLHIIPALSESSDTGRKIYKALSDNYGTAGDVYVKQLVRIGQAELERRVQERILQVGKKYGVEFKGHERFREAVLATASVGCEIAASLGLIKFDYEKALAWAAKEYTQMRELERTNIVGPEDQLREFLSFHADKTIIIRFPNPGRRGVYDPQRIPRTVAVRFEYFKGTSDKFDQGLVYIEQRVLNQWLAIKGYNRRAFMEFINSMEGTTHRRYSLGKGVDELPTMQTHCYVLNMNSSVFSHLLEREFPGLSIAHVANKQQADG